MITTMSNTTHEEMSRLIAGFTPTTEQKKEEEPIIPKRQERTLLSLVESMAMQASQNRENTTRKDGILFCDVCGSPLEAWVKGPIDRNGERKQVLMPVRCECDKKKAQELQDKADQADFERELRDLRRTIGMSNVTNTFADDDRRNDNISSTCLRYVNQWGEMRDRNTGILFFGDRGTGKSFFAECIVNALAEKRILTGITTTAELMLRFQGNNEKEELIDAIKRFQLLALDDLGTERTTSFGVETMYSIINARYMVKKPTIITTNLNISDLLNETDIMRGRLYDRVIEMCPIQIPMSGESRRKEISKTKLSAARNLLKRKNEG